MPRHTKNKSGDSNKQKLASQHRDEYNCMKCRGKNEEQKFIKEYVLLTYVSVFWCVVVELFFHLFLVLLIFCNIIASFSENFEKQLEEDHESKIMIICGLKMFSTMLTCLFVRHYDLQSKRELEKKYPYVCRYGNTRELEKECEEIEVSSVLYGVTFFIFSIGLFEMEFIDELGLV